MFTEETTTLHDSVAAALDQLAGADGELPDNTAIEVCFDNGSLQWGWPEYLGDGFYGLGVRRDGVNQGRGFKKEDQTLVFHCSKVTWARAFQG